MPAIEPDTAATLARDAAERSEAAADLADRRGRDAHRLTRWMVCIATSLAAALAVQMIENDNCRISGYRSQSARALCAIRIRIRIPSSHGIHCPCRTCFSA